MTKEPCIRIGVGGWTYEPWRGTFYPAGLPHKRELEFASRQLTSIEVNGTFYGSQKPESFARWHDESPDDFVFALKAPRFATNRRVLAQAGDSIERFFASGLLRLGDKLGPINWQFAGTKVFDPADFAAFLKLLPKSLDGIRLRHAVEVRHPSFAAPAFHELAREHAVAIVHARGGGFPEIDAATTDFVYARIMTSQESEPQGVPASELKKIAATAKEWTKDRDVFLYFIAGAKVRNPAAAMALIEATGGQKK